MSIFKTIGTALGGLPLAIGSALSAHKATTAKEVEALANVRKKFPGPDKCSTGLERLSVYRGKGTWDDTGTPCGDTCTYITNALHDMQDTLNDWHIPRNEPEYINAYNTVMGEYKAYYMAHCVTADPVLSSAVVNNPMSTAPGTTPVQTVPTAANTPAGAVASGAVSAAGPVGQNQLIKGIPNWVLWAAGGLALLTVVVVIAKSGKHVSTPS